MAQARYYGWLTVRLLGAAFAGLLIPSAIPDKAAAEEGCPGYLCDQTCDPQKCVASCNPNVAAGQQSWKDCTAHNNHCDDLTETCPPKVES